MLPIVPLDGPGIHTCRAARILRSGGVFAAYDHRKLPTMDWEAEEALVTFWARVDAVRAERGLRRDQRWPKAEHLHQMRVSGRFRYLRETWAHSVEMGNANGWSAMHGATEASGHCSAKA